MGEVRPFLIRLAAEPDKKLEQMFSGEELDKEELPVSIREMPPSN